MTGSEDITQQNVLYSLTCHSWRHNSYIGQTDTDITDITATQDMTGRTLMSESTSKVLTGIILLWYFVK